MKNSKFYLLGTFLCILAVIFIIYALSHPECSFPWPNWVTYVLYGLYAIYTVLIFMMPRFKGSSLASCLVLLGQFISLALLAISVGIRNNPNEGNLYLPAALAVSCFSNFANIYLSKRNKNKK